ncbi:hypothetical protein GCM10027275_18300 [Rhabdobacter roseus]
MAAVTRQIFKQVNLELTKVGLPIVAEQMPILMTIHFIQEPLSQQEIANLLQKDKAGVQRSIQTMRKGGFLHIEDDPHDKRRNIVSLTTSGRFACEKAIECVQEFDARLKSQLTEQESELISKVLDKLLTIVND